MREIKFRAWHTQQGKMYSAEEMAADQLTLLPTGSFINVSGDSTRLSKILPRDIFIPMQYTGLKDKNGVEIYEGDTVKLTNPKYQIQKKVLIGEVIFSYASFGVDIKRVDEWTNYTEGVEPSQTIYFLTISGSNNIEVIGNIYENKGLVVNG